MYSDMLITIEHGKEYQSRKECIYQSNLFFAACYQQAANCLQEILAAGQRFEANYKNFNQKEAKFLSSSSADINRKLLGYPNNIIAFCAERGQGKTSAMVSFAGALQDIHCDSFSKEKQKFWNDIDVSHYHFLVVDRIDPTTMEEKESIVKTVLSRMFNQFQVEWERRMEYTERSFYSEREDWQSMRLDILKQFQRCYRSLQVIEDRSAGQAADLLEQMVELGDSSNLRGALYLLIQCFLHFMCQDHGKEACLVIQIDDADFNIERAYNIIDDIRRYLVLPKVVVLLAANMTQLETTVEQHFIEQYSKSIQNGGMASVERCHDIAERYISKVIPGYRRIFLPDLQKFLASQYEHLQVKYLKSTKDTGSNRNSDSNNDNILEEGSSQGTLHYQDQLLRFLYQRTGLIFLKPEKFLHNLLPGNMRELTHFLAFFNRLDKLDITYFTLVDYFSGKSAFDEKKMNVWRNNLSKLEHYLLEVWAPINLRTEGHALLRSLQSDPDDSKNWNLLRLLPDYYGREYVQSSRMKGLNWVEYRDQFKEVCRSHGLSIYDTASPVDGSVHASYADVCEALNVLSALPENNRHYKFIYAIHLFYTIRLNQLLLDQIEHSALHKYSNENVLATFLSDVLFKRKDLKDEPRGYALWQYEVCASDLQKLLNHFNYQRLISRITTFFRRVESGSHGYITRPITGKDYEWLLFENKSLQFNFFYSNLQDIDFLISNQGSIKRLYCNEDYQNKMAGSFVLLLNWDVQYEFLRNLRYYGQQTPDIYRNMRGVFSSRPTVQLLSQICQLTDISSYDSIFQFYTDYKDDEDYEDYEELARISAIIQCVVPLLKSRSLLQMKKQLDVLKEWVNKRTYDIHMNLVFRNIPDRFTPTATVELTALQNNIQPLLYLHGSDLVNKNGSAVDWTLGEVRVALNKYAAVLDDEMKREGISHNTEKSGEEGQ